MRRFLIPLLVSSISLSLFWLGLIWLIPPVHFLIVSVFLLLLGLILAGWISLGLYYLRRIWGQKDSPRVQLRNSLRQGVIVAIGVTIFLLLQLLGAINPLTVLIILALTVTIERLT